MRFLTIFIALAFLAACNAEQPVDKSHQVVSSPGHNKAPEEAIFKPRKELPYVVKVASPMTDLPANLESEAVQDVANLVADWQIRHMDAFHASPLANFEGLRRYSFGGWLMGTMAIGMTEWGKATENNTYLDVVRAESQLFNWQVEERVFDADDYAIGQTYLELYDLDKNEAYLKPLRARLDHIYANWPVVTNSAGADCEQMRRACRTRWTWIDALFMGAPVWVHMAQATGDSRYLEFADHEFWASFDNLWDPDEGLVYRDERFPGLLDRDGKKVFWSRGNGWIFAAFARLLPKLPADHPNRQKYIDRFTAMAASLAQAQSDSGYWTSSLLNPSLADMPENSGSGFYTFGLAWGINAVLLDKDTYLPVVEKAWQSLVNSVYADGRLAWVQPAGSAPAAVQKESTDVYGVGAFLLAASELYKLSQED